MTDPSTDTHSIELPRFRQRKDPGLSIIEIEPGMAANAVSSVYIHVPFCFHKCHYCDFYSIVDTRDRREAFVSRLIGEIETLGGLCLSPLRTIFIGGGTPTLLDVTLWKRLTGAIRSLVPLADDVEFTVEANPETVTGPLAHALAEGGVNRISIGAQSFDPRHLKTLERWHDPANVERSVQTLRDAGIDNINLDLICGIPGQSLDDWRSDLDRALALEPAHLSCYTLMYEPGTPLAEKLRQGRIERIEEELEAAMYEATIDGLDAAGFEQYEISNWARPAREPHSPFIGNGEPLRCRHNLAYWTNENWWPLGPSASGHVDGRRWKNVPHLGDYLAGRGLPPVSDYERLRRSQRIGETLMLRLRLREGIPFRELDPLLGRDRQRKAIIRRHLEAGLLEKTPTHLRLSRRGLLLADVVLADLL